MGTCRKCLPCNDRNLVDEIAEVHKIQRKREEMGDLGAKWGECEVDRVPRLWNGLDVPAVVSLCQASTTQQGPPRFIGEP